MAKMIRINLSGKKKATGTVNVAVDQVKSFFKSDPRYRGQAIKVVVLVSAFYLITLLPSLWLENELAKIDADFKVLENQSTELQKEADSKKKIVAQMKKLSEEEVEVKRQLQIIGSLASNRSLVFQAIERVGILLPEQAWIDHLDLVEDAIKLNGAAWEYSNVNDFVRGLTENTQFNEK
jgi:Tfp pilus assembly protein PilN